MVRRWLYRWLYRRGGVLRADLDRHLRLLRLAPSKRTATRLLEVAYYTRTLGAINDNELNAVLFVVCQWLLGQA